MTLKDSIKKEAVHCANNFSNPKIKFLFFLFFSATIAPARESGEKENPLLAMLMNLNLVVPAAAAILVIIAAIVVICVLKGRNNAQKGKIIVFLLQIIVTLITTLNCVF